MDSVHRMPFRIEHVSGQSSILFGTKSGQLGLSILRVAVPDNGGTSATGIVRRLVQVAPVLLWETCRQLLRTAEESMPLHGRRLLLTRQMGVWIALLGLDTARSLTENTMRMQPGLLTSRRV